jgi:hypothetical protein
MPSKLILDPNEPGIDEVVAAAQVGEPLSFSTLTVVPTLVDDTRFEANIVEIVIDEAAGVIEEEPEAAEAEAMMAEMPMAGTGIDEGIL